MSQASQYFPRLMRPLNSKSRWPQSHCLSPVDAATGQIYPGEPTRQSAIPRGGSALNADQSRSNSLMLVLERVFSSTRLTITAQ